MDPEDSDLVSPEMGSEFEAIEVIILEILTLEVCVLFRSCIYLFLTN